MEIEIGLKIPIKKNFDIREFLEEREKRVLYQRELIKKWGTSIISMRANYPGEEKNEALPLNIVEIVRNEICDILKNKIVGIEKLNTLEGRSYIIGIDMPEMEIKKISIEVEENHLLGRCVDIDIFSSEGTPISRENLGYSKRKCYICGESAFVCGRSGKHSLIEIKENIRQRYEEYLVTQQRNENYSDGLADLALKSMILEVSTNPSFGLVSPMTKGAHDDMDFFMFIDSSFAIKPYLKEMAMCGFSSLPLKIIFQKIKNIGIETEKKMFEITKGVNTHKGMIFLLGIGISAVGKCLYEKKNNKEIKKIIIEMCSDILKDFEDINKKEKITNGEKLYLEYGVTGVRGEVFNGLEIVFEKGLKELEKLLLGGVNINSAMVQTLLYYMTFVEDTTILHRHKLKGLKAVQEETKEVYEIGGYLIKEGQTKIEELEKKYTKNRISPGGSADLLAITLFFYEVKQKYFNGV